MNIIRSGMYKNHKTNSKRRGIASRISKEDYNHVMSGTECEICKVQLVERNPVPTKGNSNPLNMKTLDRVDSNKPYEVGNLALLCADCNSRKGSMSADLAFKIWTWLVDKQMEVLHVVL